VFATFFAFFLPPFLPSLLYLRSSSVALLLNFSRFTEDKALVGQEDHATAGEGEHLDLCSCPYYPIHRDGYPWDTLSKKLSFAVFPGEQINEGFFV
jgi:hypothetical protein